MKIIALFNDGNMSGNVEGYNVLSFGIQDRPEVIKLDMTWPIEKIIETLEPYCKGDFIITASPPCESFSRASGIKGGNVCMVQNEGILSIRQDGFTKELKNGKVIRYNKEKAQARAELGIKCIENTCKVIQHFKPKHWYIENPQTSMMWNYIKQNNLITGVDNIGHYCMYNKPVRKATNFLSDISIYLLKCDRKHKHAEWSFGYDEATVNKSYDLSSSIPEGIIRTIYGIMYFDILINKGD